MKSVIFFITTTFLASISFCSSDESILNKIASEQHNSLALVIAALQNRNWSSLSPSTDKLAMHSSGQSSLTSSPNGFCYDSKPIISVISGEKLRFAYEFPDYDRNDALRQAVNSDKRVIFDALRHVKMSAIDPVFSPVDLIFASKNEKKNVSRLCNVRIISAAQYGDYVAWSDWNEPSVISIRTVQSWLVLNRAYFRPVDPCTRRWLGLAEDRYHHLGGHQDSGCSVS